MINKYIVLKFPIWKKTLFIFYSLQVSLQNFTKIHSMVGTYLLLVPWKKSIINFNHYSLTDKVDVAWIFLKNRENKSHNISFLGKQEIVKIRVSFFFFGFVSRSKYLICSNQKIPTWIWRLSLYLDFITPKSSGLRTFFLIYLFIYI